MRINSNIPSLAAQRSLATATRAISRALERLSTGQRVNRASDDAAGLGISVSLESQARGLKRAVMNANEAFGFLETANGVLSTQADLIQRMRELAIQAANGTINSSERKNLNSEFSSLLAEVDRLATDSQFNGVTLLDGSFGFRPIQVGINKGETIDLQISGSTSDDLFQKAYAQGTFSRMTEVSTLDSYGSGLATGDMNNDGHLDLVSSGNDAGQSVQIFLGKGDGSFESPQNVLTARLHQMQVVDFNQDGALDILGSDEFSSTFYVMLGKGDGTFESATTYATDDDDVAFTVGDFTGDGFNDLVTSSSSNDSLLLWEGGEGGALKTYIDISPGGDLLSLQSADVNNDGKLDLLAGAYTTSEFERVFLSNGDGSFNEASSFSADTGFSISKYEDLDGDGHLDFVNLNAIGSTSARIRYGNGDGTFGSEIIYDAPNNIHRSGLVIGDMNGDGIKDITFAGLGNSIHTLYGKGGRSFELKTTGSPVTSDQTIRAVGDFNEDGFLDLLSNLGGYGTARAQVLFQDSAEKSAVSELNLLTQESAVEALSILKASIQKITARRSDLGSLQNRLEFVSSNLSISTENITAARSQIIDADLAVETAELAKQQILQQASSAVLSQANLSVKMVLAILPAQR